MTTSRASAASSSTPASAESSELLEAGRELERAERSGPTVRVPYVGEATLPPPEHLVWYGVVAAMTALEIIEWPTAIIIAIGKVLADNRHSATLQNIGDALGNSG